MHYTILISGDELPISIKKKNQLLNQVESFRFPNWWPGSELRIPAYKIASSVTFLWGQIAMGASNYDSLKQLKGGPATWRGKIQRKVSRPNQEK